MFIIAILDMGNEKTLYLDGLLTKAITLALSRENIR
jgi:hypothetical protein